jgi:hypothetical protein
MVRMQAEGNPSMSFLVAALITIVLGVVRPVY